MGDWAAAWGEKGEPGGREEQSDRARDRGGLYQDLGELRPGDLAVHEYADHRRVQHRDHRRLRRRHDPAQDAAEDDRGHPERDEGMDERAPKLAPARTHRRLDATLSRQAVDVDHDRDGEDDGRSHDARGHLMPRAAPRGPRLRPAARRPGRPRS